MKFNSKAGLILSITYLGIFSLSALYMLFLLVFHTVNSEFSGLYPILITLPWSMMILPFLNSLGYTNWYDHFTNNPALYVLFALFPLVLAAMLNASILYFIGSRFGKKIDTEPPRI